MPIHVERELLITDLPRECVNDCGSGGGSKDGPVSYWREKLGFTVNRENAIACLKGYGAWDDLETWLDARLAETVLWLACGDFHEYIVHCEDQGIDPYGERPDDFDPSSGSDLFYLGG